MTKRIISMFTVVVMLLSFVACSGGETDTKKDDTTAVNPVDTTAGGIEYGGNGHCRQHRIGDIGKEIADKP